MHRAPIIKSSSGPSGFLEEGREGGEEEGGIGGEKGSEGEIAQKWVREQKRKCGVDATRHSLSVCFDFIHVLGCTCMSVTVMSVLPDPLLHCVSLSVNISWCVCVHVCERKLAGIQKQGQ